MSLVVFSVLLPWLLVGLGCWICYQLTRQNGRILLRLDALEKRLAQLSAALPRIGAPARPGPTGLPVGSVAPEFELRDLAGERKKLSEWRSRRVLLIFFSPHCGFCLRMAPDLAALPVNGPNGRPMPLVVTSGDAEENRKLVEEHGIGCPVLLQEKTEVSTNYQAYGTPVGYLIDEEGKIASELTVGAQALLSLAGVAESEGETSGKKPPEVYKGNRPLSTSRINRNGLPAGTLAPNFTLPQVQGGELTLEDYRGKRVLIVFSDPHCGPCDQLSQRLGQLHRRTPGVQVLMISRGEREENRKKVREHGLTFPVVLQKQWEISRLYGMFGTPVGYLVDEQGVIAGDVARGAEPILALLSGTAAKTDGKEVPSVEPLKRESHEQLV